MNEIKRDYYKFYKNSTILTWVWTAAVIVGLFVTSNNREFDFPYEYVTSGILILYAIILTIFTLCAPIAFGSKLKKLPAEEQNEILNGKFNKIGERRFYENILLFYYDRQIKTVKYSDIVGIEPKNNKLILTLKNGKKAKIFVPKDENSAMLAAAIKSKTAEVTVKIGGKVIENTQK